MTDTPEPTSSRVPAEGPAPAEIAKIAPPNSVPGTQVPATENGDRAKYQKTREITAREVAAIAREAGDLQSEILRAEGLLDGASLMGPDREKFRKPRNGLKERLDALRAAHATGQKSLDHLDRLLKMDAGDHALATRRGSQEAAALVAEEIRTLIGEVAELWQKFRALQEEDRVNADIVRPISPNRLDEVPTFSWTVGVDHAFAFAISQVIGESARSRQALDRREKERGTAA